MFCELESSCETSTSAPASLPETSAPLSDPDDSDGSPHLGQQSRRRDDDAAGTYQLHGEISRRLLAALPPLLVLPGEDWDNPLVGYLAEEIGKDEPGQEAVLDRLLDLLLIAVLRAAATGISRAALARRFNERGGEPPMTFLTTWPPTLAADLLCEPGATVGSVARQVGYGSPFALSTAFERVRGISPQRHRSSA